MAQPKEAALSGLKKLTASKRFEYFIIGTILAQAVVLGLETMPEVSGAHDLFSAFHVFVIAVFTVEAGLKIASSYPKPHNYFKDGWNVFDFTIVVLSFIPFAGNFAVVARLVRLLRILRLVSVSGELKLIVSTLVRSIPSIFSIMILLGILFYIYGIAGYHLFSDMDSENWGTLFDSLITLFKVMTLEEWSNISKPVTDNHSFAWAYFISFIVLGTFVVINLFIAVIIRKSEEAYKQIQSETALTSKDILSEIQEIKKLLDSLEKRLK
ncbi:ion transporter [Candidatus Nitrosotenuis cloacae]|uniref:ion transporter n=1 Tax=Candidatus Nitrosotenuis cloacae TaxID=1603555 RepID=UPI00227F4640|nr:ion transporter [Candidatus Nitrosotenuis cloacae]